MVLKKKFPPDDNNRTWRKRGIFNENKVGPFKIHFDRIHRYNTHFMAPGNADWKNHECELKSKYYGDIFKESPIPLIIVDQKGIILQANKQAIIFFSEINTNIIGYPLVGLTVNGEQNRVLDLISSVFSGDSIQGNEVRLKGTNGTGNTARLIGTRIMNPQTQSQEGIISILDSRDQKNKEIKDKETDFIAELIMRSTHPFSVSYPNGQIMLSNTSFEKLLGYNAGELISVDLSMDLTPDEWKEHEMNKIKELLRTGQPVQYEKEFIKKDGSKIPVEIFVHLVHNPQGEPQYYYSFISDITERKKIEAQLRETEDRFNQLANNVEQIFWFTALNPERVLYVNPSFEQVWGVPAHELYEDPRLWIHHIHPEHKHRVITEFQSWIEGKTQSYDVEYCIINKQGDVRWIHDRGAALVKKDGVVVQVSGIAEDITSKKPEKICMRLSDT